MSDEIKLPAERTAFDLDVTRVVDESVPLKPYRVKPLHMGVIPGLNYDCIGELLEFLEGPDRSQTLANPL